MMSYHIITTDIFEKQLSKLDPQLQKRVSQEIVQIGKNPFSGKPLSYNFFREKKMLKYRLYNLVYEEFLIIFLIKISSKKDQQRTIDSIKSLISYYNQLVREKVNAEVSTP